MPSQQQTSASDRGAIGSASSGPPLFKRLPSCSTRRSIEKLADLTSDAASQRADLRGLPRSIRRRVPERRRFRRGPRHPLRGRTRRSSAACSKAPWKCQGRRPNGLPRSPRIAPSTSSWASIERDGGTLYCTALTFGPDGRLLGKHRKLMPTALERVIWGSGDGSTLTVVNTPLGKIGSVICWENYMPLVRMAMYAKGIELYCAITVDDRETWIPTVRHIALEGRCFVLSACQFLAGPGRPNSSAAEGAGAAEL